MAAPEEVYESIKHHFVQTCIKTFAKTPYTWQTDVGSFILGCHLLTSPLKCLLVHPTGGGKTLLFTSVAACIKGITLCITPLLSLGADQVQKVMSKTSETDKSIIGFHLDELTDAQLLLELQNYLSTLPPTTTKTIVLFSSLVQRSIVSDKIRFLVFNEIHLAVHYGKTFRKEFGHLGECLSSLKNKWFILKSITTESFFSRSMISSRRRRLKCLWCSPQLLFQLYRLERSTCYSLSVLPMSMG